MKRILISILFLISFLTFFSSNSVLAQYTGTGSNSDVEYVEGYYKDNGTYVEGYYRTEANEYNLDNFSAKGNFNPYTGETGDKIYDSPYNSLSNDSYNTEVNYDYSISEINSDINYNYNSISESDYELPEIDSDINSDFDFDFE